MKQPLNVKRLRLLVDDPAGDNQMFADEEYEAMYEDHEHIYCLAAEVWLLKAGELQSASSGAVAKYKVGDESYDMTELGDLHDHAMSMYNTYKDLCDQAMTDMLPTRQGGAYLLKVKRPEVL